MTASTTKEPVHIAVLSCGIICKRHVLLVALEPQARLAAIVEPCSIGEEVAQKNGTLHVITVYELLQAREDGRVRVDGAIHHCSSVHKLHISSCSKASQCGHKSLCVEANSFSQDEDHWLHQLVINADYAKSAADVVDTPPFTLQLQHFILAIRGEAKPACVATEGATMVRAVDAVKASVTKKGSCDSGS